MGSEELAEQRFKELAAAYSFLTSGASRQASQIAVGTSTAAGALDDDRLCDLLSEEFIMDALREELSPFDLMYL